jgi:hypothetical protein
MDDEELDALTSKVATDAQAIASSAFELAERIAYVGKETDRRDATFIADIKAVSAATESLVSQTVALHLAAAFLTQLRRYHIDAESRELAAAVEGALQGESVFLYADGTLPEVARFAVSVHRLVDDHPLYTEFESTYFRGSLIGSLFRGSREVVARIAGKIKDALVGETSAAMTHEEVRAYRDFVEATNAVPNAILITERYAFAKVAAGVFAFRLDRTRKAVLRQEPVLGVTPESFVKRMLALPQAEDVELPANRNAELP